MTGDLNAQLHARSANKGKETATHYYSSSLQIGTRYLRGMDDSLRLGLAPESVVRQGDPERSLVRSVFARGARNLSAAATRVGE